MLMFVNDCVVSTAAVVFLSVSVRGLIYLVVSVLLMSVLAELLTCCCCNVNY